jgi:hypothetical protein
MESNADTTETSEATEAGGASAAFNWKNRVSDLVHVSGSNYRFVCNYCLHPKVMTGGASRFKEHLLGSTGKKNVARCLGVPDDVLHELKLSVRHKVASTEANKRRLAEVDELERESQRAALEDLARYLNCGSSTVSKRLKQTSLEECEGAALLDVTQQAIARMWYRGALPFHLVYAKEVVDAFDAVCEYGARTGNQIVPLPSAASLRGSRLESEVARIHSELAAHKKAVAAYGVSLQSDGKDNMARRHLVNIVTTSPLGAEFREVIDVSGTPRDSEATAQALVDAARRLEKYEQENLVTIVTDTPSVNRKAWKILEEKLPGVQCVPCAAHVLNLHFKHVFKEIPAMQTVVANAKLIVQRFSNTDFARSQLRLATPKCTVSDKHPKGRQIELYKPGETRFATNYRMLSRLLELQTTIQQVTFSQAYKDTCVERKNPCPVTGMIGDGQFWNQVSEWVIVLEPAYAMLREVDTYKPTLHTVYESALEIQEKYETCTLPYAQQLRDQWTKDWEYLHVPLHSAAYALHPRYQDDSLQNNVDVWPEMLDVCHKMLGPEAGALAVEQYNLYQEGQGAYGTAMAKCSAQRMDPAAWWKSYGASTPQLQCLAMKVLSQPGSAASSEQSWSEYDFVHSKKRNRLKTAVASHLVYVHSNLRLLGRSKTYARHEKLLVDSNLSTNSLSEAVLNHTDDWDGDCSEDDDADCQSAHSVEPNSAELDTSSLARDEADEHVVRGSGEDSNEEDD